MRLHHTPNTRHDMKRLPSCYFDFTNIRCVFSRITFTEQWWFLPWFHIHSISLLSPNRLEGKGPFPIPWSIFGYTVFLAPYLCRPISTQWVIWPIFWPCLLRQISGSMRTWAPGKHPNHWATSVCNAPGKHPNQLATSGVTNQFTHICQDHGCNDSLF